MSLKQMLKRLSVFLMIFVLFAITNVSNPAMATTPQGLYDKAWLGRKCCYSSVSQ